MSKEEISAAKNEALQFLLSPISKLKRVGEATASAFKRILTGERVFDLLLHKPTKIAPILIQPRIFDLQNGELVALKIVIESHIKPAKSRQPYKIVAVVPSGHISLVFFKIYPSQIEKLAIGREVIVIGNFLRVNGENQIVHPQEIFDAKNADIVPRLEISYPTTYALTQKFLRHKINEVILHFAENLKKDKWPEWPEWINANFCKVQNFPDFFSAIKQLHSPKNIEDLLPQSLARRRLAYDEILSWQIALLLVQKSEKATKPLPKIFRDKKILENFLTSLPFSLTKAQRKAILQIEEDVLANGDIEALGKDSSGALRGSSIHAKKMLRLLQGDVGSGKTIIAIYSCLLAFLQNGQSCVLAPITLLAEQHFEYFQLLLEGLQINISLLTGKTKKKEKEKILQELQEGKIDILISTHAVLQDNVKFHNLKMAVIDEQHRFGVMQRLKLVEKNQYCDVLLMSATPIPRSLMMAMYGDMDITILDEKPAGRKEISTLIMSQNNIDEVLQGLHRAIARQEKIFWICPAIAENEDDENSAHEFADDAKSGKSSSELMSAEKRFSELQKIFGNKVALIHGKMKESAKEKVMEEFAEDQHLVDDNSHKMNDAPPYKNHLDKQDQTAQILVATTVIEVGIDVKSATIIVIENAENFGLSQLHQLRGRVGRNDKQCFCILLYGKKYGAVARKRLNILRQSNDGFFIAEEDLKLRGAGELLGVRQSGIPEFKIADLAFDLDLVKIAHKNAQVILNDDANLNKPQNQKYRNLLALFNYDQCLKMVEGG